MTGCKRLSDLGRFRNLLKEEHDSCGIVAVIEKDGNPRRDNLLDAIDALVKMEHRSGFINGEGDGCGILTDIPRGLWERKLADAGLPPEKARSDRFVVGHLFIPKRSDTAAIQNVIRGKFKQGGLAILVEEMDRVNSHVLGKNGRADEPHFWQIALEADASDGLPARLFELVVDIESRLPVQAASLSNRTAVYKVMGAASLLTRYFHDLARPEFRTAVTIGHNRYSTNTLSNFFRVQPFSLLGHNGEINTIRKLRDEARMIGAPLAEDSSDSQDLNRVVETLIHRYGFSLFEAIEMVFPPILHELKQLPDELKDLYSYYRQVWGPFAQGPAAIVSRYGDECAFSVDALGLRPLWMLESERTLIFSSEQGILPVHRMVSEPKPLAPGETVGVQLKPRAVVLAHHQLQRLVLERAKRRADFREYRAYLSVPAAPTAVSRTGVEAATNAEYAAFGWDREHIQLVEQMADTGSDPIRSLGYDGPLAALSHVRQNISDFIKESVAVVTNPAIDREREMEHFSTRVILGGRPPLCGPDSTPLRLELPSPILAEGALGIQVRKAHDTLTLEEVVSLFDEKGLVERLSLTCPRASSIPDSLDRLAKQAVRAVRSGKTLLLLDDADCHRNDRLFLDPHLAVSRVDLGLKEAPVPESEQNLRRRASILLRSAAIRSLHDVAVAVGLGADLVAPRLMFAILAEKEEKAAPLLYEALNKGLEKVISTIGIHELRGYARLFSSIGLSPEVAGVLDIVNFCGSGRGGTSWEDLKADAEARYKDFSDAKAKPVRTFHLWPRIWKSIGQVASGDIEYREFADKLEGIERENPISLRHVADLNLEAARERVGPPVDPGEVDIGVGDHSLPLVISSMSFGSQNEVAFRAYAEAAERLNMVSLNGEGGEIKDMLGKYPRTRGHQIASGRFGVNVELANSALLLEIKIGQGAKPGEGGHLPGKKVSAKVAAARNASPGVDLISPSNNHDIYSIEDLAQIITELKTANKYAKVIVKVPVVPNIGTISVGIAKAGADIITLSGFDGGTGAARIHALQHVGLPVEIGVKAAHAALVEAGIRHQVELWADGGLKSGLDVIKMVLLGADRVGFGTLAMLAIGCTTCRGCHLDTCHVGIATQIETVEEAQEHGLKRFVPRRFDVAVDGLVRLFTAFGEEIRRLTGQLGFRRLQDMVGRSDLLVQTRALDRLDLTDLLRPVPETWKEQADAAEPAAVRSKVPVAAGYGAEADRIESIAFDRPVLKTFRNVGCSERVLVSSVSGARVRNRLDGSYHRLPEVHLTFEEGSVPGNGLAAFNAEGVHVVVKGGAQDGVGKTAFGGKVSVLKSPGASGKWINGSVGKGFCYGAQKGLFIVQGNADSRTGIRLSGADVIIAGEPAEPLRDDLGMIANRANIKGFAFEYMTAGRAVVLGDPGPWICSGMTGGRVYLRLIPEMGLDEAALMRRIARGAKVHLEPLDDQGIQDLRELLGAYQRELLSSGQVREAEKIEGLMNRPDRFFLMVIPDRVQSDPSISTE